MLNAKDVTSRCELAGGDFFESVPTGGDAYISKNVIHDWDDEHSVRILQNIRRVMPANGKLLLVEMVVPSGNGAFFGKFLDVEMLLGATGGRERTEAGWRSLLERAGFRLTRIVSTASPLSVIEAVQQ